MKHLLILFVLAAGLQATAQTNYWQQYLKYNIDVRLDDKDKSVTGAETIVYKNNSPDALSFIWFHIFPNAYKDDNTALFKQLKREDDLKAQMPGAKSKPRNTGHGYISNLAFTVNGTVAKTEAHPQYIDVIKVLLPKPLLPNESVTIATPFYVKEPPYFSRSGYGDDEFMICQWYPKPATYDKDGWHDFPYLEMGEFYGEYASYKVNITVPSAYVVSATGVLQNANELAAYKSIGAANTANPDKPKMFTPVAAGDTKTLTYVADTVPDFAWFADKNFVVQYDTLKLASHTVDAFTFFHKKSDVWKKSVGYVKDAVHYYGDRVGEYAYPVVQAVEGPANSSSGGMEYPMVTLITVGEEENTPEGVDAVIAHEVGHNWFMAMLGTNERDHPWMDEGLNTYYMFRYEAEKYRRASMLGPMPAMTNLSPEQFQSFAYGLMAKVPVKPPIETPSADFTSDEDYGMTVYMKPAVWMYSLEATVGKGKVDSAFQNYFRLWKFKHPQPDDMKAAFEQSIGGSLNQFFGLLRKEGVLE